MRNYLLLVAVLVLSSFQAPTPTRRAAAGVWVSPAELATLPTSGAAWDKVVADAGHLGSINLADQDDKNDSYLMAEAIRCTRLGTSPARAHAAIEAAMGTEAGARTLALGRNLVALVVAADLTGYRTPEFLAWLDGMRTRTFDGRTLVSCHEKRGNNWSGHAGASRAAIAAFLGDQAELARCAQVLRGWLGDRSSYAAFEWGDDLSWHIDPSKPVGVNPVGAILGGRRVDGVQPDDQRRCGSFPADFGCQTNYAWENLQGVLTQAVILRRRGYDTFRWQTFAVGRAAAWLVYWNGQPPQGDDLWQVAILNRAYPRLALTGSASAEPGKGVGYSEYVTISPLWPMPSMP